MKFFKFLFFTLFIISDSNLVFAQDTINWRSDYKLKLEDFKGTPDTSKWFDAYSDINFGYFLSVDHSNFECRIVCYFNRANSWMRRISNKLLDHEQVHFDIDELYARKFFRQLKGYKFNYNSVNNDIDSIYAIINEERQSIQNKYDKESEYSNNALMQLKWKKWVLKELYKLKDYRY